MIGSLVISESTFSQVQEMASTESSTGVIIEGNYRRGKQTQRKSTSRTSRVRSISTQSYYCRCVCVKQQVSLCKKNSFTCFIQTQTVKWKVCLWMCSSLITTLPQYHPGLSTSEAENCTPAGVTKATAHRGLAKSLISIFYEGTQRQALE